MTDKVQNPYTRFPITKYT